MGLELPPQEGGWPPCHAGFPEGQARPAAQGDANEMLRLHECAVRHTEMPPFASQTGKIHTPSNTPCTPPETPDALILRPAAAPARHVQHGSGQSACPLPRCSLPRQSHPPRPNA